MTLAWFDDLPKGWQRRRIKTITPVLRGASPRPIDDPAYFDDDGEYAWVRISDVTASSGFLSNTDQRLSSLGASKSVKLGIGELFLSIAGSVGKPCITSIKACIHDGFVYFPHLPKPSQGFLRYIFESGQCFAGLGKLGTQLNLNTWTVGNIEIPCPNLETQQAVAAFLDCETARIDQLIGKREVFLNLVAEKKAALTEHALNGAILGLSCEGKQGWFGRLPVEWPALRTKNLFRERLDRSESGGEELLSVSHITGVTRRSEKDVNMFLAESMEGYKLVHKGDVVINTMWAWMGAMGVSPVEGLISPSYGVYAPTKDAYEVGYIDLLLRSKPFIAEATRRSKGIHSSRLRLYPDAFLDIPLPVPSRETQRAILAALEIAIRREAQLATLSGLSLDRLREFRASLITAAVSGQIDISTWQKRGSTDRHLETIGARTA